MPDIAMCQDKTCPKRESCYRYTATPSMLQSYFMSTPRNVEDNTCDRYWPIKEPTNEQRHDSN